MVNKKKYRSIEQLKSRYGYGFTAIWVIGFILFFAIPVIQSIIDNMVGTFKMTPGANLFNATTGMYLTGENTLHVTGVNNVSI